MTNDELKRATVYSNKASALVALNTMTVEEGEILIKNKDKLLQNFRQNRFISSYRS